MTRLDKNTVLTAAIQSPAYAPESHGIGVVHLGIGAFLRAHQAVYTDDALARSGGDWRILGVSLRARDVAEQLDPQDGRYGLLVRGPEGVKPRIIGSVAGVSFAPAAPTQLMQHLAAPSTRIVSLTITEKGYGLDRATGGLDHHHPGIAADLRTLTEPRQSAIGLIVEALRQRQLAGQKPFTVLSCDNFSGNGRIARRLTLDFAKLTAPDIVDWLETEGRFPSSMVDRITPATTPETLAEMRELLGVDDFGAVQAEPFSQWIIEDDFVDGRPDWEAGGAQFVVDVTPYEEMKLRMLNGAHSTLAYAGYLAGMPYVRDTVADPALRRIIERHCSAAGATLPQSVRAEAPDYATRLLARFANPAIAHETYQIAMDGTQKLPQRIFAPALAALDNGQNLSAFAFSTAAWMRYALGRDDQGKTYALRDPRESEITSALNGATAASAIVAALSALPGLIPERLTENAAWRDAVALRLDRMLTSGMPAAIAKETSA